MNRPTPEYQLGATAELLQSLHGTVRRIRQQAERFGDELAAGEDAEYGQIGRQVAAIDGLVRTCLKVEASLLDQQQQQAGIAQGGYALDLEEARSEIGIRLARLRASSDPGEISD